MKKLLLILLLASSAHAEVLLRDIGIIGLMSHDIFAWDHKTEVNTENGRLDLSTIFDWGDGARWEKGGNPKNGENAPVYTITMKLVEYYKKELKVSGHVIARQKTVVLFHAMVRDSFERLSGLPYPATASRGKVNNTEQAALRGMHDILPGTAKLFHRPLLKQFTLTNFVFARLRLNEDELNQAIPYFNGDYAPEYQHIKVPFSNKIVNLKKTDGEFIAKFSPYQQEDMLTALGKVGRGELLLKDVFFVHHIGELVAKALCPVDNAWMPQTVACY